MLAKTAPLGLSESPGMAGHAGDKRIFVFIVQFFNIRVVKHQVPGSAASMSQKIYPHHAMIHRIQYFLFLFSFKVTFSGFVNLKDATTGRHWLDIIGNEKVGLVHEGSLFAMIKSTGNK